MDDDWWTSLSYTKMVESQQHRAPSSVFPHFHSSSRALVDEHIIYTLPIHSRRYQQTVGLVGRLAGRFCLAHERERCDEKENQKIHRNKKQKPFSIYLLSLFTTPKPSHDSLWSFFTYNQLQSTYHNIHPRSSSLELNLPLQEKRYPLTISLSSFWAFHESHIMLCFVFSVSLPSSLIFLIP